MNYDTNEGRLDDASYAVSWLVLSKWAGPLLCLAVVALFTYLVGSQ